MVPLTLDKFRYWLKAEVGDLTLMSPDDDHQQGPEWPIREIEISDQRVIIHGAPPVERGKRSGYGSDQTL
jgi:hypothetical protein